MNSIHHLLSSMALNTRYPGFSAELNKLLKNACKPREEREKEQALQMQKALIHAFHHVPFYKQYSRETGMVADDFHTQADLQRLPIITKEMIVNDPSQFTSDVCGSVAQNSTGGSTGVPLKYLLEKESARYQKLVDLRARRLAGFNPGDRIFTLAGGSINGELSTRTKLIKYLTQTTSFSSLGMSESMLQNLYEEIEAKKPKYFYGYPSSFTIFCDYLQETKQHLSYRPRALFSTAEVLGTQQRTRIEEVMQMEVFDHYGMNDGCVSAHDCKTHNKHIDYENGILQIVDETGNLVNNGTGRVIATTLHNYSMPFIRYDTGDIATISDEYCSCGCTAPILKEIDGRTTDYIKVDGIYIGSPVLTIIMGKVDALMYRVVQETDIKIVVYIVLSEAKYIDMTFRDSTQNYVRSVITSRLPAAQVEVLFCKSMQELGIENKHKLVINKTI